LIFFPGERRFWVAGDLFHSRPRWCRFFLACLLWAAAAMQAAEHDAVFTSAEEQEKWLADAMALVQHHAFYMHRALVSIFFSFPADLLPPPRSLSVMLPLN